MPSLKRESGQVTCDTRAASGHEQLRAKLDLVIQYLERLDCYYHAHGADFTPPGWDITVQELIHRLKDGLPAVSNARTTHPIAS